MERKFKGVWIPADVWLDERLSLVEKCVLVEIDSLSTSEEGCTASNLYLAKFAQLSIRTVVNAIAKLYSLDLITITNNGSKHRIIVSNLNKMASCKNSYSAKNNTLQRKICAVENSTAQNMRSINIVSKKVIKKMDNYQAHAYEVESYNDILDNLDVHGIYRLSVFEFIKHLHLNGHQVINSRLESLIISLDRRYPRDDVAKCIEIKTAITNGYVRLPSEEYNYN